MEQLFRTIGLIGIAIVLLIGTIAFIETSGYVAFGLLMISLLLLAVFCVADVINEIKSLNKLIDLYRDAEKIYKDSLKVEREYSRALNDVMEKTLVSLEMTNNLQRDMLIKDAMEKEALNKKMNSVLAKTMQATRAKRV